jgi:alpha-galactosidase
VFLLAGQSNMEGHGIIPADPQRNNGRGSLEFLAENRPDSAFAKLRQPNGQWIQRTDVFVHYLDRKGPLQPGFGARPDRIGPELGFGITVGDACTEPVVLLKLAWGGKSLAVDFRPPSAGSPGTGPYYTQLVERTQHLLKNFDAEFPELAGRTPVLAGIAWHQGWNDRINQAFNDEYASNLAHLIRDLRRDLNSPNLPFVIAETGMSGPEEKHPRALSLMKAQASVPALEEFSATTAFVPTRHLYQPPDQSPLKQEYHWNANAETYYSIGRDLGLAMLKLSPP